MNDTTENHVECGEMASEVKAAEIPSAEELFEVPMAEKPVENPMAAKPDIAMEFRKEFEYLKYSFAKQNEMNAAVLNHLDGYFQDFYKNVLPFFNRLGQRFSTLEERVFNAEKTLKALQDQTDTIAKQSDTMKELSGTINKLQDCITRYQNDVLFKAQKELLEDMIQLSDQVRYNVLEQTQNKNYDSLLESMKQIGKWIDASLERSKMHKFEDCSDGNTAIDKKRQEVVEVVETENAEKEGCFVSRQPGYLWTIPFVGSVETMLSGNAPQTFEFVFRPEQVAKLKYVSKKKK